jgi:FHS family L-fucose permease-like MFS transporter
MGYFAFAIPAALFMKRFGYKGAVLLGLCLFGTGALLFWPAAQTHSYNFFLGALFVIASGLAFLETSANPLVTKLGPPEGAERRLNLAQAFNPLGSIAGVFIGREFILADAGSAGDATSVQTPYLVIALAVFAWAALIAVTRFPKVATERAPETVGTAAEFGMLLRKRRYMLGVAAQFFYVGAQVGVWSYLIRYMGAAVGADEKTGASYLMISLALFMAGRFAGALLMGMVRPARLLGGFAAISAALCIVAAFAGGWIGVLALVATSFFMSVMFPTIFALSIRGLGDLAKPGASLLVMAIVGGAALTALMGFVSDASHSILLAMLVPAGCFLAVLAFARKAA